MKFEIENNGNQRLNASIWAFSVYEIDPWVGGWVDGLNAILRIAHSNKKSQQIRHMLRS